MRCAEGWVHVYTEAGGVLFAGPVGEVSCVSSGSCVIIKGPGGRVIVYADPRAVNSRGVINQTAREATERIYLWLSLALDGLYRPDNVDPPAW